MSKFPHNRPRRLRKNESTRLLAQENWISPNDLLAPVFVTEGQGIKQLIPSMPNVYRYSLDMAIHEVKELFQMGVKGIMLFVKVSDDLKDNTGAEAVNPNGLFQTAIKTIKDAVPEMMIFSDIALDPYSSAGHDGIVRNGEIVNDETNDVLCQMALSHAQAGVDFVAPSDMMDGRISAIRQTLETSGFANTGILAYSAKYASCYYGPFRDALDSAPVNEDGIPKNKKTYQLNPANSKEGIKEILLDMDEGADIVMVKPAMSYLDIIRGASEVCHLPIAAYHVSGEYSMIHASAERGWLDLDSAIIESTLSIKRAGASLIATYFSKDIIRLLGH